MKILMLVPDKGDPTCFYRASGIAHDLEKQSGHEITTLQWNDIIITWQLISNFDIIMMQRPFTDIAANLCDYAKEMNRPVWVDYDDNLFALNPENTAFHTYNNPVTKDNVKKCIQKATVVTVPNEYLRQSYIQFNKNIEVIPNAFNDDILQKKKPKKREKKVLWRGPETHIYDLMSFGHEINAITKEFTDHEFLFMGYYPWFFAETENKSYVPGHDIIMYFSRIHDLAPKVFHVPLHDNLFNRCRSNIGFIEGTYSGAACVVPAWWNTPGSLLYNNGKEYQEAIRSILIGDVDCEKLNSEAWEYVLDVLPLSRVNKLRVRLIEKLLS